MEESLIFLNFRGTTYNVIVFHLCQEQHIVVSLHILEDITWRGQPKHKWKKIFKIPPAVIVPTCQASSMTKNQ